MFVFVHVCVCLFVYLSVCLFICLFVCLFECLCDADDVGAWLFYGWSCMGWEVG